MSLWFQLIEEPDKCLLTALYAERLLLAGRVRPPMTAFRHSKSKRQGLADRQLSRKRYSSFGSPAVFRTLPAYSWQLALSE